MPRKGKRQGQRDGDEHHSANRADTENQQIEDRPFRIVNRAENEQGHCGGARETVNDAYEQRAQQVKKSQPPKESAWILRFLCGEPRRRSKAIAVMVFGGCVRVPVKMHAGIVSVKVGMLSRHTRMSRGQFLPTPVDGSREVEMAR